MVFYYFQNYFFIEINNYINWIITVRRSDWRVANSAILDITLTNQFFNVLGLKSLTRQYIKIH